MKTTGYVNALRVRTRMQILTALTLVGLLVLCVVSRLHLQGSMLEEREQKTKNLVEVGIGVLAHYHKLSADGKLPEPGAKAAAFATLRGLRYAGSDYFYS